MTQKGADDNCVKWIEIRTAKMGGLEAEAQMVKDQRANTGVMRRSR